MRLPNSFQNCTNKLRNLTKSIKNYAYTMPKDRRTRPRGALEREYHTPYPSTHSDQKSRLNKTLKRILRLEPRAAISELKVEILVEEELVSSSGIHYPISNELHPLPSSSGSNINDRQYLMVGGTAGAQEDIQSFVDSGYAVDIALQDNGRFSSTNLTNVDDQQSVSIEHMDTISLSVPSVSGSDSSGDVISLDSDDMEYDDTSAFSHIAPLNQAESIDDHLFSEVDAHSSEESSLTVSDNGDDQRLLKIDVYADPISKVPLWMRLLTQLLIHRNRSPPWNSVRMKNEKHISRCYTAIPVPSYPQCRTIFPLSLPSYPRPTQPCFTSQAISRIPREMAIIINAIIHFPLALAT